MSIIVVCEIDFRVSDKMGILSWCTAACVTFFCFVLRKLQQKHSV